MVESSQVLPQPKSLSSIPMISLFLLFISLLALKSRLERKCLLKGVLGPRQYLLGNWLNGLQLVRAKDATSVVRKWCEQMQGCSLLNLALGPLDVVVLVSAENIQKIFGSGDINFLHKPKLVTGLVKPVPWYDGVSISRGDKWRARRKLIVSKLSHRHLLNYSEPMSECSKLLVTRLESLFEAGGHQAIEDTLLHATFHTICKIIFGIESIEEYNRFDCDHFISGAKRSLIHGPTYFHSTRVHLYEKIVTDRFKYPWLAVDFIFRLHPSSKELARFYQQSRDFIGRLVEDYQEKSRSGKVSKPSLLADLVTAGLPLEAIYEEITIVVLAGYETTGRALNYLLLLLALNPNHQERCRQEVDLVLGNDAGEFTAKDLTKKMPYLEQCILEALRLFPPFSAIMRELEAAVTLDENVVLPAGTIVAVLPSAVHMNPRYYPNPERFDPERFSPEGRSGRSPFAYLPFSAGPRGCLGAKYAMNELMIMTARILRHFEIFTDAKLEEIRFVTSLAITTETPIKFLFKKRAAAV